MYTTVVVWPKFLEEDALVLIRTQDQEIIGENFYPYSNLIVVDRNGETGLQTTTRKWTDLAAAQEWINFVNTFDPPPISAEVI
jgi:hypothetical protein